MNLIPESNNLYKLNNKEKLPKIKWIKRIAIGILIIFSFGVIFQSISNFIGNEKVQARLNYAKVDGKKIEYILKEKGDYTIVFTGAIGVTLYSFDEISKSARDELKVNTFAYNRAGYGFSDIGSRKSPEEQAKDLKIVLRKAGVSEKIILVGEEYGSLVATSFANMYPEVVSGMLLINPYDEETIKTEEFKKSLNGRLLRSKFETIGCYFGLTELLNSMGKTSEIEGFEDSLSGITKEEFLIHKTKKNYRQAINYEIENLTKYDGNFQTAGFFEGKPLYIISKNENEKLATIGTKELTTIYKTQSTSEIISISDKDSVVNGISSVLKEVKKIDKKAKK